MGILIHMFLHYIALQFSLSARKPPGYAEFCYKAPYTQSEMNDVSLKRYFKDALVITRQQESVVTLLESLYFNFLF